MVKRKDIDMKYAIQWYDPYMPEAQLPFKDGEPRGSFNSREEAEQMAEEIGYGEIPYEVVEI